METNMFKLIQKDTEKKSRAKEITKGTYWQCLAKFHEKCSFSYFNHKKFSTVHYEIKTIKS